MFNENTNYYKKIKRYYNFFENKIIKDEEKIFKENLEYLIKNDIDISKCKLDSCDLLENEVEIFNNILKKEQELHKTKNAKEVNKEL